MKAEGLTYRVVGINKGRSPLLLGEDLTNLSIKASKMRIYCGLKCPAHPNFNPDVGYPPALARPNPQVRP